MNNSNIIVLMLSPRAPAIGGISTWTEEFLVNHEYKNIVIKVVDTAKGVNIENIIIKGFKEIFRLFKILCEQIWLSIKIKPQIVHINSSCSKMGILRDFASVMIGRAFKMKIVLYCHCNISDQLGDWKLANYIFSLTCKISHEILVLNSKSYDFAKKYTDKVTIVPNYINSKIVKSNKSIRPQLSNIVYTGRIVKNKGIFEIFDVAKMNPSIVFKLVGPVCENFSNIYIPANVEMPGVVSKEGVIGYLDEADVFLLLSYSEGFSFSLLEAMSRGLPAVTTNVGANKDMLENHGGIIIESLTTKKVIEAIDSIKSFEARSKMSLWNLTKISEHYTADKVIPIIDNIYNSLIDDRRV